MSEYKYREKQDPDSDVLESDRSSLHLVVWNDDFNTFDWVITSLVEICHHSAEQAEQCALFIHFKGKYTVQHGSFEKLDPMCKNLLDRGISATIETEVES